MVFEREGRLLVQHGGGLSPECEEPVIEVPAAGGWRVTSAAWGLKQANRCQNLELFGYPPSKPLRIESVEAFLEEFAIGVDGMVEPH